MLRTLEAVIDEDGNIRLLESVELPKGRRALVTILEEEVEGAAPESLTAQEWDELEWLRAAARNPAFDYLHDPEEDIYSIEDGQPFRDDT